MGKGKCLATAAILVMPLIASAQSASQQPVERRSGTNVQNHDVNVDTRNREAVQNRKSSYNNAPGNSEHSQGKKGQPPGQAKKGQNKQNKQNKNKD